MVIIQNENTHPKATEKIKCRIEYATISSINDKQKLPTLFFSIFVTILKTNELWEEYNL
jgi:hypothetical protein